MQLIISYIALYYVYILAYLAAGSLWSCFKFLKLVRMRALDAKEIKNNVLKDKFLSTLPYGRVEVGTNYNLLRVILGGDLDRVNYYSNHGGVKLNVNLDRSEFVETIDQNLESLKPGFSYLKWSYTAALWPASFIYETLFGLRIPLRILYNSIKAPMLAARDILWSNITK